MKFNCKSNFLWIGFAILFGSTLSVFSFAGLPNDPTVVTVNSLGWVSRSEGWCLPVIGAGAAVDLWASAPATVDRKYVRYVEVMHADTVAPANGTPICVRVGPGTDSPALTCDPIGAPASTTGFIASEGRFRTFEIEQMSSVPIWLDAAPVAFPVAVCITVYW